MTQDELKTLRAFQRQVDRLRRSSIVQRGDVTFKYTTKIQFPTGEVSTVFEGYDKAAFQSQLPLLRQFLLNNDPVNFYKIHNILMMRCDRDDLKCWVKYARQLWKSTLDELPKEEHRFFYGANQSVDDSIQHLFYGFGGLFHVNIDVPEEEDQVQEIMEAMLQNAFPRLWNCLNNVDSVIHIWLDAPTMPIGVPPDE